MTTINENESIESQEFFAFNDTDRPQVEAARRDFVSASQGIDTTLIDPFRQGVELRTHKQVYNTTQPKIWAGNLKHRVKTTTYGQARDFTQYDNSQNFLEKPIFDPVWYIEDPTYPHPIIFNDGPMQEEEAIIEPFTIPFRLKNSAEGPYHPHFVRGCVEDGNNLDSLDGGTTRTEQFIEYNAPRTARFFLDEGHGYMGQGHVSASISIPGYIALIQRDIDPFDDTADEEIVAQVQTTNSSMIAALKALDYDLSEDIRGTFNKKCTSAGGDVYGPTAARFGTDSIAFRGLIKGS